MRAFRLAYDGTGFRGFQRQPDVRTVEDVIFDAFAALDVDLRGRERAYAAAGRTDAGVSALGQTIAVESPPWLSAGALNGELPPEIRAWATAEVEETFHPRHDADERAYTYHLYRGDLDFDLARTVGRRLEGTHDFHNVSRRMPPQRRAP